MAHSQNDSKNKTKHLKISPPLEDEEKRTDDQTDCPTSDYMVEANTNGIQVIKNIYENPKIGKNANDKESTQNEWENPNKRLIVDYDYENKYFLIPVGNGLFKLIAKNKKRDINQNNISGNYKNVQKKNKDIRKKEKTNIMKGISIKRVENSDVYKNPLLLEKKLNSIFSNVDNAYLLPLGDIRVWFKSEEDATKALMSDTKPIFGPLSFIRRANYNSTKIVVYSIPKDITVNELKDCLKKQNIETDEIKLVERANGTSKFYTAFLSVSDLNKREQILEKGKIRIGYCFYNVKKYEPRRFFQCFKCQKYGHVASLCKSLEEKCGICSENHLTKLCTNQDKPQCSNCEIKKPAYHHDCVEKIKYVERIKKKPNSKIKCKKNKENNSDEFKNFDHQKDKKVN